MVSGVSGSVTGDEVSPGADVFGGTEVVICAAEVAGAEVMTGAAVVTGDAVVTGAVVPCGSVVKGVEVVSCVTVVTGCVSVGSVTEVDAEVGIGVDTGDGAVPDGSPPVSDGDSEEYSSVLSGENDGSVVLTVPLYPELVPQDEETTNAMRRTASKPAVSSGRCLFCLFFIAMFSFQKINGFGVSVYSVAANDGFGYGGNV